MTFTVIYSAEALSILENLDPAIAKRILSRIEQASKKPTHFFVRLKGSNNYKLRAGDCRAIALLDFSQEKIFVITIGHRKNVYDRTIRS